MKLFYSDAYTANGQNVYLCQKVKTGMQLNSDVGIVKRIDNENDAVFVVSLLNNIGGWYSINTCIAI